MRVKHKDTKKEDLNMSMSLSHWQKEYYPNKKYLNYEFYDVPDIYDLFEINPKNGNLTYITSDFANSIFQKVRKNPIKFVSKEHDSKYLDEYLMLRNLNTQLSFKVFLNWIINLPTRIPTIKQVREIIINSTTSKLLGNLLFWIFVTVVGGILVLIIWTLYNKVLIGLWSKIFNP